MKLLTKKLLENAQGDYVAQVGLTWQESRAVRDLVQKEINRQRQDGKLSNYQFLKNSIGALHAATNHLNYSYDKRQQGRYLKATPTEPNKSPK